VCQHSNIYGNAQVRHYEEIEFRVPGDLVLKGDNVAQVAVLHNREAGASVVVANTHILYAPARGDVKLLQLKRLFRTLEQVRGHLSLGFSFGFLWVYLIRGFN
jgi:mRNA deadenylase 3'-5' endonuclease subunit Ccr4